MNKYLFKTNTTMKPYNCKKWWIDRELIPQQIIKAESLDAALEEYRKRADGEYGVSISDNALKTRQPMYIDFEDGAKQIGFVITGSTEFNDNSGGWSTQYIELWVEILTVVDTKF